jgi:chromosome segregation ATPase
MRELDRRIATLRLRLAEVAAREDQVSALLRQFRSQLERLMDFAVYDRGDLDSALSMAEEVDARMIQAERSLGHLRRIRARGQEELNALLITSSIEAAKADVAELETQVRQVDAELGRLQQSADDPEILRGERSEVRLAQLQAQHLRLEEEIRRLRHVISEASDEAARTVAERAGGTASRAA